MVHDRIISRVGKSESQDDQYKISAEGTENSEEHRKGLNSETAILSLQELIFFFNINLFILFYLWLCWVFVAARRLFSGCEEQGLLFVAVRRLLIVVASFVGSTGSRHADFSSCGTRAQ